MMLKEKIREMVMEGGCACGQVRYRLSGKPLVVNACHCTWCQRETGTVHALNAVYEFDRVEHLKAEPEIIDTPSASGKGQRIARCPACKVAIWSNYPGAGPALRFVRVGTMDDPTQCPPGCPHLHVDQAALGDVCRRAQRCLPSSTNPAEIWSDEARARFRAAREKMKT